MKAYRRTKAWFHVFLNLYLDGDGRSQIHPPAALPLVRIVQTFLTLHALHLLFAVIEVVYMMITIGELVTGLS
jgi:hypothetical protein